MSVRAMRFRAIMAQHFKRVVFSNGEHDTFGDSFSVLSPDQRRRYDSLGETIESQQVVIDWYGKAPKEETTCPHCNENCLSKFKFCPFCGGTL